jgi:hypothetical protein
MEVQEQGNGNVVVHPDGSGWSVIDRVSTCRHAWSNPFELFGRSVRRCMVRGGCQAIVLGAALIEHPPEWGMDWDNVVLVDKGQAFPRP